MFTQLDLGSVRVNVMRKDIKNIHLGVYPPNGTVRISAPAWMELDTIRLFAINKLAWIKRQQKKLLAQQRETPREFVERESHYVWGKRYLLEVAYKDAKPSVELGHRQITLTVRPGSDADKRAQVVHQWHKSLLHEAIPDLIAKWQRKLNVKVNGYYLQRMKTKWGSCNHIAHNIRLNTELIKKPRHLLEYVIVHEMCHLIEPTHSQRFVAILDQHFPTWRESRAELNELPLSDDA